MKPKDDITVRKARVRDLDTVLPLFAEFMEYHARLDPLLAIVPNNRKHIMKYLRGLVYGHNKLLLVAEYHGRIIGFLGAGIGKMPPVYRHRRVGVIQDVFVVRPYRRRGVSGRLLAAAFTWFKESKTTRIELGMSARNRTAIKAWQNHGFKTIFYRGRRILD